MRANLTTRKQSQQRFFHKGDCDCRDCREQERRFERLVVTGFALVVVLFSIGFVLVRVLG